MAQQISNGGRKSKWREMDTFFTEKSMENLCKSIMDSVRFQTKTEKFLVLQPKRPILIEFQ
jgi:hypothetical protein